MTSRLLMTRGLLQCGCRTILANNIPSAARIPPARQRNIYNRNLPLRSLSASANSSSSRMRANADDYYQLLGISQNATQSEIKKAYYRLAKDHHPDRSGGDPELFAQVSHAYETLSDPQKRRIYDRYGAEGVRAAAAGQPPPTDMETGTLDDILREFGDIFGGAGPRQRRAPDDPFPGEDQRAMATITLQEAAYGVTRTIRIHSRDTCKECEGSGKTKQTSIRSCIQCGGEGRVRHSAGMFQALIATCPRCKGAGSLMENPCQSCEGDGIMPAMKEVTVNFPPGCDTGMILRVPNGGGAGIRRGPAGDLFVQVEVQQDDYFHRQGRDLHIIAPISIAQATLGGKVLVKTIDGNESVIVKAGTQPDDIVTLPGRALRGVNSPKRGNQVVHFKVVIPDKVSTRQEELLRELMELEGGQINKPEDCSSHGLWQRFRRFLKRSASTEG